MKTTMRILVVDDEKSIRLSLRRFLRESGMKWQWQKTHGMQSNSLPPEIITSIVSDIVLLGTSGFELIRTKQETRKVIQVVLMTGEPTVEIVVEAVRVKASDYLGKPVNKAVFLHVAARAVERIRKLSEGLSLKQYCIS